MNTQNQLKGYVGITSVAVLSLCLFLIGSIPAFANERGEYRGKGNPPGPVGGPGAGPRWKNPHREEGWREHKREGRREERFEEGREHRGRMRYHVAEHRLDELKEKRQRLAASGAPADVLGKLDQKIQTKQSKIEEFRDKWKAHQEKNSEGAKQETPASTQPAQQ